MFERAVRVVDALVAAQIPADLDPGEDAVGRRLLEDAQHDRPVGEVDLLAGLDVVGEPRVVDADPGRRAERRRGRQLEEGLRDEADEVEPLGEPAGPDLRPGQILQDGDVQAEFLRDPRARRR